MHRRHDETRQRPVDRRRSVRVHDEHGYGAADQCQAQGWNARAAQRSTNQVASHRRTGDSDVSHAGTDHGHHIAQNAAGEHCHGQRHWQPHQQSSAETNRRQPDDQHASDEVGANDLGETELPGHRAQEDQRRQTGGCGQRLAVCKRQCKGGDRASRPDDEHPAGHLCAFEPEFANDSDLDWHHANRVPQEGGETRPSRRCAEIVPNGMGARGNRARPTRARDASGVGLVRVGRRRVESRDRAGAEGQNRGHARASIGRTPAFLYPSRLWMAGHNKRDTKPVAVALRLGSTSHFL